MNLLSLVKVSYGFEIFHFLEVSMRNLLREVGFQKVGIQLMNFS